MKPIVTLAYLTLQMQVFCAFATHVVGGEMNYKYLGNNNYEIRLTVYRDCWNGVPPFDNPAAIGIFDVNNILLNTLFIAYTFSDTLAPTIIDPCLIPPTNVCYERTTYTDTVNLPPIPGGYQIVYQRCCRNTTILNIVMPLSTGATYIATIPDPSLSIVNSNPVFNNWPPTFICSDEPFSFDHSATDLDGDSLVYLLCDPLDGANTGNPMPQPPFNPPYVTVTWQPPYGPANLFGGTPLTINSQTGWLTCVPNTTGQFVYGVCVEEYRNGNLLSTTKRDYQMNVVTCPPIVVASILSPTLACGTLTASFTNNSFGAGGYHWDFGVQTLTDDTSDIANPSYAYPDTGTYTSMLIAYSSVNPGCTDTSWGTVIVYPPLIAGFTYQGIICSNTILFTDTSPSYSGAPNSWLWNFGDNTTSNLQNPGHTYSAPGPYMVTLIVTTGLGCIDTVSMNINVVNPLPVAAFTDSSIFCTSSFGFNNQSQLAISYSWDFGDNTFSSAANPSHTYPQPGTYLVTMVATDSLGCTDTVSQNVSYPIPPDASFNSGVTFCSLTAVFNNTSSPGVISYRWNFGDGDSSVAQNPAHTYPDTGTYSVTLIVTDNNGCTDTIVQNVVPEGYSIADFTYSVDTCAMQVMFENNSVFAHSVLWNFGDGSTSDAYFPYHVYSKAGIYPVALVVNPGSFCADTMETTIDYNLADIGNIWVPNAFTPNGDGKNEEFKVFAYYPCDVLTFTVFNRWGEKIYEYTGSNIKWDGMYRGRIVEPGIYVYIIKGLYTDKIGSIAVIR